MYWLLSRYYDPEVGRFINADAYISTGQGIVGFNMYAYCNNNPANYYDPSGGLPARANLSNVMLYGGGGYTYHESDIERAEKAAEKQAHNINNTDEKVVLDADNWAFYKGKLVIKVPFMDRDAASFGVILLGSNVNERRDVDMIVQHEYGHTVQFDNMGLLVYTAAVAIPSLIGYGVDASGNMPFGYYSQPWEYGADLYGGVTGRSYENWANLAYAVYTMTIPVFGAMCPGLQE